ncbi:MAG TPA: tRNA (N(6)-L-threonylcarbamoyladenosine(37)-C(2))-methylthiotransferase MtaB [Clostridia bacterium]|nr:tRNA (N(6)-L-threonylcarbamoyladenosine(37)-C(2))-methylthiotransferase MtaB [Clostridia bacterium]
MRVAMVSLGCKTNQYEMDALAEALRARNFEIVSPDDQADIYILNTCTVTAEAERKSRQLLRRFRRQNAESLLVACGCYSQREDLTSLADITIGTGLRDQLPDLISEAVARGGAVNIAAIRPASSWCSYEELGAPAIPQETRAFLKIQDGCDNRCAYCAICLARGPARSREIDNIVSEAEELVGRGYSEIVLTGTNINAYGVDFEHTAGCRDLASTLEALDRIEGIQRIRLGSLESATITSEFVLRIEKLHHLCPSFHLSLQSGSDRILKAMCRRDTKAEYRQAVHLLREAFPNAGITTDLIVGFPGETRADFLETLDFCDDIGFLRIHVFRFSRRPGTQATSMQDQVEKAVSIHRSRILREKATELALRAIHERMGETRQVLVERFDSQGRAEGYTPEYIYVKGSQGSGGESLPRRGDIRLMRIRGVEGETAIAEIV